MEMVFACDATLGEGAAWDGARGALWWVDILGRRLFLGDLATGRVRHWDQPDTIGAARAAAGGRRAVVRRRDVVLFDPDSGEERLLWTCRDEPPGNRFNDAGTDRAGNLWIASMDDAASAPTGALWRLTPSGLGERRRAGMPVVNGPVVSPDGCTLYVADSAAGRIDRHTLDPETGRLGPAEPFVELAPHSGLPDGMTVDAAGNLWVARITAGRVSRYTPDGRAELTLSVPVPMPTSVALGGDDMSTLFVTTARILLDQPDLAAYPASGSVFAHRVDVPGLAEVPFAAGAGE